MESARSRAAMMVAVALVAVGAVALPACSWSPRNNQRLAHTWEPFNWGGATAKPNQLIALVEGDVADGVHIGNLLWTAMTSATVSRTDAKGVKWYSFGTDVTLPPHWRRSGPNTLEFKVRSYPDFDAFQPPLATFDFGAAVDNCIRANESGGGSGIINNCKSAQSGVVTLTAPCGTLGEGCCVGACDAGLACQLNPSDPGADMGLCLKPAGAACQASSQCVPSTSCVNGVCAIACTNGSSCTVSGKRGPCASGVKVCSPTGFTCTQTVFPATETCDGKDNDCNGAVDNGIAATACETHPTECSARGTTWKVPGQNQCVNGRMTCTARSNVDYCNVCGTSECGACAGNSAMCTSDSQCAPSSVCDGSNGRCNPVFTCRDPGCWLPSEKGKNCLL